jgi:hypothetical protein
MLEQRGFRCNRSASELAGRRAMSIFAGRPLGRSLEIKIATGVCRGIERIEDPSA